jgi:TonB family protein
MVGTKIALPKRYRRHIAICALAAMSGQSALAEDAAAPAQRPSPAAPVVGQSLGGTYAPSIRAVIVQHRRYPTSKIARLLRPVGMVRVAFTLARSGKLIDVTIEQSAGSILDQAALDTIRETDFPPFPDDAWPGQQQHRFSVELDYHPN